LAHRYVCEVLEEMRKTAETGNYSYLPGLIEEVQVLANRMEASLGEKKDIERYHEYAKEAKASWKVENKKLDKLKDEIAKLEEVREGLSE